MVSAENWREPGEVEAAADSAVYWRAAYEQYGPALLAYLLSRLPRRDDAEDLLQETFVRAIRASGSLRDEGKLRSYLFTVAHNLMINQVRRTRVLPLSATGERGGDTFEGIADDESDSPEDTVHLRDLDETVAQAMEMMTPAHREAFRMGVLEGRPYSEIARLTGWSLAQVKINIYRARKTAIAEIRRRGLVDEEPKP